MSSNGATKTASRTQLPVTAGAAPAPATASGSRLTASSATADPSALYRGNRSTTSNNNSSGSSFHVDPALPQAPVHTTTGTGSASDAANGENGPTDAIIEELKALAKSMLDATNAARRRAHTLESRRSYEALMSAIEGRAAATAAGALNDANHSTEAAATLESSTSADTSSHTPGARGVMNSQTMSTLGSLPHTTHRAVQQTPPPHAQAACVDAGLEDLIEVPESLSRPAAPANGSSSHSHPHSPAEAAARKGKVTASTERDLSGISDGSHDKPHLPTTLEGHKAGEDDSVASPTAGDEEEENIFDGVKTQVFFRTTDVAAYNSIAASTWKPEQLLRKPDGSTIPDDSDEDSSEDSKNGGSSSSSTSDEGSEDDDIQVGRLGTRNRVVIGKKPKRVYRVPLFPYGGGITEAEALELSQTFTRCIRNSSRGGSSKAAAIPAFVSKNAFVGNTYAEIAPLAASRREAFSPQSPYEFVVEVERPVLFDAVHAREQRRRQLRELVKKGEAPVTMGTFNLRVIMDPIKTGFEDEKQFPIVRGTIVADRYQIVQLLGKATFSRAVRCYDLQQPIYDDSDEEEEEAEEVEVEVEDGGAVVPKAKKDRKPVGYVEVCLKIINNTKDFFDQSLDEIRLLTLINAHKDPDEAHVLRLIDAFYYKEHTMLVTELLSDNLYEYSKYNREEEDEPYFTLPRLRRIARQIAEALAYVHSLNLIHADLKPENILFLSHRRCIIKVIDFGSSCFLSDHLSSYIQSRSYRAPEVVLGCDYDGRIDVWSLGAILAELVTGDVLFTSETVPEMLARIVYVCGHPLPRRMLWEGRHTSTFINKFGLIYESSSAKEPVAAAAAGGTDDSKGDDAEDAEEPFYIYTPVPGHGTKEKSASPSKASDKEEPYTVLRRKLAAAGQDDEAFFSFVKACLTLDHKQRPTSAELLSHPFIANEKCAPISPRVLRHMSASATDMCDAPVASHRTHPCLRFSSRKYRLMALLCVAWLFLSTDAFAEPSPAASKQAAPPPALTWSALVRWTSAAGCVTTNCDALRYFYSPRSGLCHHPSRTALRSAAAATTMAPGGVDPRVCCRPVVLVTTRDKDCPSCHNVWGQLARKYRAEMALLEEHVTFVDGGDPLVGQLTRYPYPLPLPYTQEQLMEREEVGATSEGEASPLPLLYLRVATAANATLQDEHTARAALTPEEREALLSHETALRRRAAYMAAHPARLLTHQWEPFIRKAFAGQGDYVFRALFVYPHNGSVMRDALNENIAEGVDDYIHFYINVQSFFMAVKKSIRVFRDVMRDETLAHCPE